MGRRKWEMASGFITHDTAVSNDMNLPICLLGLPDPCSNYELSFNNSMQLMRLSFQFGICILNVFLILFVSSTE